MAVMMYNLEKIYIYVIGDHGGDQTVILHVVAESFSCSVAILCVQTEGLDLISRYAG